MLELQGSLLVQSLLMHSVIAMTTYSTKHKHTLYTKLGANFCPPMSSLYKEVMGGNTPLRTPVPRFRPLEPAISCKRTALLNYKQDPSEKTLVALRRARSETQRIARQCANNYWQNLCLSIQTSADCGNIRAMYEGQLPA